jgi:hypothetical protein
MTFMHDGARAEDPGPAEPDLDDVEVELLVRERRLARGLRVAARRAIALARRYRREEGPRGLRETACVRQALAWRAAARGNLADGRPGLARTTGAAASEPLTGGRRAG